MESINKIFIRDLRVRMYVGVFAHEQGRKRTVLVNAEVVLAPDISWKHDEIDETVSYEELVARVMEVSARKHFNLLEVFLESIAADFFENKKVIAVKISAEKPSIIAFAKRVGVEITRIKK